MPTYIALINFTEQGIAKFKETRKRAAAFSSMAGKAGVTVKELYWAMGRYDGLLILEADDEKAISAVLLQLGAQGNVHTQTLRAFTGEEVDAIIARASGGK